MSVLEGKNLLIVDDDPLALEAFGEWLRGSGASVDTALNSGAAVQKCENFQFDAVSIDLNLDGSCGGELAPKVRKLNPEAVLIALTGRDCDHVSEELIARFDDCLEKWTPPEELIRILGKLIHKHA